MAIRQGVVIWNGVPKHLRYDARRLFDIGEERSHHPAVTLSALADRLVSKQLVD